MNDATWNSLNLETLNEHITKSWDNNVIIRASDLEQGTDKSYHNLILPWVLERVKRNTTSQSSIVDIGCGCGYLTNAIYETGRKKIIGVDISKTSINYAKCKYPNITFQCTDICRLEETAPKDLCLAVMVLNNMPSIHGFFKRIRELLVDDGSLIIVIPHPCFWPNQHLNNNEYNYENETAYEFSFATQGRKDYYSPVLYFHRMLETYLNCFEQNQFVIKDFYEVKENDKKRNPDILCIELSLSSARDKRNVGL